MFLVRHFLLMSLLFSTAYAQATLADIAMPASLLIISIILVIALLIHIKQLQKSERLSAMLFSYTPCAMLLVNKEHKIIKLNKKAALLLAISEKNLLGHIWYERLIPDEDAISIRHQLYKQHQEHIFKFSYLSNHNLLKKLECELTPMPYRLSLLSLKEVL